MRLSSLLVVLTAAIGLFPEVLPGQGFRSLSGSAEGSLPSNPFNAMTNWRLELRISDFQLNHPGPGHQHIFVQGTLLLRILQGSSNLSLTSFADTGSPTTTISIAGRSDIVVRVQRRHQERRFQIEIWDANGQNYAASREQVHDGRTADHAGPMFVGQDQNGNGAFTGKIAYLRWFSSLLPAASAAPNNIASGDLFQHEFENSLNDSGARRINLRNGRFAPSYSNTRPVAILPEPYTIRAGYPHQLDGSSSGAAQYRWEQVAGPSTLIFDNPTSPTPTITGAVFGYPSYLIRLQVIDGAGQSATSTLKLGAVATNEEGVVIPPEERVSFVLGPMLRDGLSPWPFYDRIRKAMGHELGRTYASRIQEDLNSPAEGTIQVTRGSTAVTGEGTNFQRIFKCNGNDEYMLVYSRLPDGNEGRSLVAVSGCSSPTDMRIGSAYSLTSASGLRFQRWDGSTAKRWTEGINYYDSVLVQYQNWYRTGIDDFLHYARTLADGWWQNILIDSGTVSFESVLAPRRAGFEGLTLRAMDGRPEFFPFLKRYIDFSSQLYLTRLRSTTGAFGYGTRETGFTYLFAAVYARTAPQDSDRTRYLDFLRERARDFWNDYQCKPENPAHRCRQPLGAYRWPDPDFYKGNAEVPFHTAIAMEGLIKAHQLTGDNVMRTVLERFLENNMHGSSGNQPIYNQSVSGFNPNIRCRSIQYWAYADPGPGTNADGVNHEASACPDVDRLRSNRTINNEFPNIYGYLYSLNPLPEIKERGDDMFSATFGKDEGPGADGYYGYVDAGVGDHGKQHGQSLRSSGTYLAYRLNSLTTPALVEVPLPVEPLANVPNAVVARVKLTAPNGAVQTALCREERCVVKANARLGGYLALVEYVDAQNQVQRKKQVVVPVPRPQPEPAKELHRKPAADASTITWKPGSDSLLAKLSPWTSKLTTGRRTALVTGLWAAGGALLFGWAWMRRRGRGDTGA